MGDPERQRPQTSATTSVMALVIAVRSSESTLNGGIV
jgi:hypothetical protein